MQMAVRVSVAQDLRHDAQSAIVVELGAHTSATIVQRMGQICAMLASTAMIA